MMGREWDGMGWDGMGWDGMMGWVWDDEPSVAQYQNKIKSELLT